MIPVSYVVLIFLSLTLWLTSCLGHVVTDVGKDADDIWPVLCPPHTYYSRKREQCLACSQCPLNKIITIPCHGLHNTKCGPFRDFIQADVVSSTEEKFQKLTAGDNIIHKTSSVHSESRSENKNSFSHTSRDDSDEHVAHFDKANKDSLEFTDSEWKFLTISLFIFLSFFVVAIFVVGICLFRRKVTSEKKFVCEYSPPVEDV